MTTAEQRIKNLKKETKNQLFCFFDSLDEFYETFYLMIKTEHQIDMHRPKDWENRLRSIQYYRHLATERMVKDCSVERDLMDDIYSDYFDDFANFKERECRLSDEKFLALVKKIIS